MQKEPEIFGFFQHKVEWVPHFARVSEVRHIYIYICIQSFHYRPRSVFEYVASVDIMLGFKGADPLKRTSQSEIQN